MPVAWILDQNPSMTYFRAVGLSNTEYRRISGGTRGTVNSSMDFGVMLEHFLLHPQEVRTSAACCS